MYITKEISKSIIDKAIVSRKAKIEAGKDLISNFADEQVWKELFKARGFKMPAKYIKCEIKLMRRYLRKIGMSEKLYLQLTALKSLQDFIDLNPRWPLYAFVGFVCEYAEMKQEIAELLSGKTTQFED
jgi:hypothetical protein